jgi:putative hydrolase of the HAD superfamily
MGAPSLTHVFFDIGGVLATNGWDRDQRARAREHFGLDDGFEDRHQEVVGELETGALEFDEYLDITVFQEPRPFSREAFRAFVLRLNEPFPSSITLARRVAEAGRVTLMTLNNESEALNLYRIERFGLRDIFSAFLSSCWLRLHKPSARYFERALAISQADPARSLFIDDREHNLVPARALGFRTHHYTDAASLEAALTGAHVLS